MKWRPGKLVKDSSILTLGMGLRGLAQGIVFIIITRAMGADGYGAFVAVLALSSTLAGFVGFGSHILLIRDTALDNRQFHTAWGGTLSSVAISIPFILLLYIVLSKIFLSDSIDWTIILLIGISDIILLPFSNICISAYQGFERMGQASILILMPILVRLIAAGLFLVISHSSDHDLLLTWSILYLLATLLATLYSQYKIYNDYGFAVFSSKSFTLRKLQDGIPFSFWNVSNKLYNDADKIMLARITTLDVTGVYSAAHRLVDLFTLPILGLIEAATPRSFKEGGIGIRESLSFTSQLVKIPTIYATCISLGIYFLANLLPYLIGHEFEDSIAVIKYLSALPLIIVPKLFLQHILATTGHQKIGMWIIVIGAALNIISNLLLIPSLGWTGAVISTYIAEIVISIILTVQIYKIRKKYQTTQL